MPPLGSLCPPLLGHFVVEHLYAHHMDLVLVRVYVSADLHVMPFMALQCFGIDHLPSLARTVRNETDLVAFSFHPTVDI